MRKGLLVGLQSKVLFRLHFYLFVSREEGKGRVGWGQGRGSRKGLKMIIH